MQRATTQARILRHNATDAERLLWQVLRSRRIGSAKFRRQHTVEPFIADFACVRSKLIVEADGGQHAQSAGDAARTARLEAQGWRVLHFWNDEILRNPEGVLQAILAALTADPSPSQR